MRAIWAPLTSRHWELSNIALRYQPRRSRPSGSYFYIRIPTRVAILGIGGKKPGPALQSCLLVWYWKGAFFLPAPWLSSRFFFFGGGEQTVHGHDQSQTVFTMCLGANSWVSIRPVMFTSLNIEEWAIKLNWSLMSASKAARWCVETNTEKVTYLRLFLCSFHHEHVQLITF